MRKIIISFIIMFCFLSMCSCSRLGAPIIFNDDGTEADARLEEMLEIIENQDKDALKALFSEQAVDETGDDFDGSMEEFFNFFQGEIESWDRPSGPTVFKSNSYGQKTKQVSSYYYITTDEQEYFFLIEGYTVNTDQPENVGIYLLLVVKTEDEDRIWDSEENILFDGNIKLSPVGIYIPIK